MMSSALALALAAVRPVIASRAAFAQAPATPAPRTPGAQPPDAARRGQARRVPQRRLRGRWQADPLGPCLARSTTIKGDAGQPTVVARSSEAPPRNFTLPPGNYIVHAAYGFAGATKRI